MALDANGNPRLPDYVQPLRELRGGTGRRSATELNDQATDPERRTVAVTGKNKLVRITFGRDFLPGKMLARGFDGGDLVIAYEWCRGPIDEVEETWLNGEDVPVGVTVTHYTGTDTQGVDSDLAAAVPAYADTNRIEYGGGVLKGVAYSVYRIPVDEIDGWPRATAVVKGLAEIYDPRDDSTGYTDNPALFLDWLISDPYEGRGIPVYGVSDCADWCDSLLGGVTPRARLALTLAEGRNIAPDLIDLLCEYAECWWEFDGAGVRLIPDKPVDLGTVPVIEAADIVQGTLRIDGRRNTDRPTEIEISHKSPTLSGEPWPIVPTRRQLPGVAEGDEPRIPSGIQLEGIYRAEEASNKALARLNKLRNPVEVSWETHDKGVLYLTGDVVKIEHPTRGADIPVRLINVGLTSAGRYYCQGLRYDEDHYPSELTLPANVGVVPEGAALLLEGTGSIPDGYTEVTDSNGLYMRGAPTVGAAGGTGGTSTVTISGQTAVGGGHSGAAEGTFATLDLGGSTSGPPLGARTPGPTSADVHQHDVTLEDHAPNPLHRSFRIIEKTGGDGLNIPAACRVFGLEGISAAEIQRLTANSGRLIRTAASAGNGGVASQSVDPQISEVNYTHAHHGGTQNLAGDTEVDFGPFPPIYYYNDGPFLHAHSLAFGRGQVTTNPKRARLALYGGVSDFSVLPGMMFAWRGGATLPTDFVFCDGSGNTIDLRDALIEIAVEGEGDVVVGDDTVRLAGTTSEHGHNHRGSAAPDRAHFDVRHDGTHFHDHDVDITAAWVPPHRYWAIIMYAPGG